MDSDTRLLHAGRDPERQFGVVNPPLYRASTILYPTLAAYDGRHERRYTSFAYGIHGTPTTLALAEALTELSGGARTSTLRVAHPWHNWFLSAAHGDADVQLAVERTDAAFAAVRARFGPDA